MSSSYELEDMVADELSNLFKEGAELMGDEVPVVTSLKDEGALQVTVAETIPEDDVADDPLTNVVTNPIIHEVWRCLKKEGEDVGIIGVYGMGGVGKTTLLKQIYKKLDLEMKDDFDVVIWVVVSRDLQLDKIQQQIGKKIGLFDEVWKDKNSKDKASDIFQSLKEKKFVLLMDGLWERVDLTKVGVPLPSPENSSKIVFTTRSLQICSLMEADKLFKVTCLSDNDAWKLFEALVGNETLKPRRSHRPIRDRANDPIVSLARGVCRKCCGLPLALVSIGQTVRKKSPEEWSVVSDVLKGWTTSYPGLDDQLKKDIRDNLKLSYDNLQNDMFKSCFLYCCLLPRDREIKKRDLIDCWIGEGFLDGRLGAVQSQGHYIIDVFLSVCLLEQSGKDDSFVKMHYWIRDMSLWLASKIETEKGNCFFCPDTYNFKDDIKEKQVIRDNLKKATRMSLLDDRVMKMLPDPPRCPLLQTLFLINGSDVISEEAFFNVMPSLKVLNLSSNSFLAKLQSGISNLISLQHLDLSCTKIQELPKELRALKKLKCLNLEETERLLKIPRQLISEFSVLHVLRLWKCGFMLQPNEDRAVCNDAQLLIEELLCLKNLSMLSITFMKNSHALQRLLSSNRLQSCIQSLCLQDLSHPKSIKVPLTDLKHLNELEISNCKLLEELEVDFVGEAQAQDVRESPSSFNFLDKVMITGCPNLRELTWLILAPNLKHLRISDCEEMEEIIHDGKLSECPELMGNVIPFSKLKIITLQKLPILRSIYWSNLPFPDLKELAITDCPRLPLPLVPPHLLKITIPSDIKEQEIKKPEIKEPDIKEPTIWECPMLVTSDIKEPEIKEPTIRECPMLVTSVSKHPQREEPMVSTNSTNMGLLEVIWPLQVGNALLGGLFQVLFERLVPHGSPSVREYEVHSELSTWFITLAMIEEDLGDAEEKQWTSTPVKMWLDNLRDFAYDLEDMLDEHNTEILRRSLEEKSQTIDISNIIEGLKSGGMTQRWKELCVQRSQLGLVEKTSTAVWQRPSSTCLPTEPAICGRDEDKAKLLEMVLRDEPSESNFRVISIVGMAGVGKTTLAKQVYNHTTWVTDFDRKAWICVSNDFDVFRMSKAILESITHSTCDLKDLNEVQVQLRLAVAGRRFLLVLDDVWSYWSENYCLWETLKSPFVNRAQGSRIIVTTRWTDVASTMGGLRDCYYLNLLSDDHCWSVFQMHAFENGNIDAHQNLDSVREKVVQKCGGLPLAARTLGGLLRSKHRNDEWEDILNCRIWDLPELKLSYYHLPSHLKRCFAFCAILPKNYEFEEKELVLLWMAEGLILRPTNNKQLEDMGSEYCLEDMGSKYFRNLLSISIFQQSTGNASKFAMHNLFNDLAQWVSGETCFRLEDKLGANQLKRLQRARHSSYISSNFDGKNKFDVFYQVIDHLRTFLPILTHSHNLDCYISDEVIFNLLPMFKKLRVLSLRKYRITKLPDSIGELRYLRYLNLADTEISSLPDSILDLFNLQVLILRNCSRLSMLPPEVDTLINLRHLDIGGIKSITEMPLGMQELKYLETLSNFIVGKDSGSPLKDLKNLKFLGGELVISQLENVTDSKELGGAILIDKKKLEVLILEWGIVFDASRNEDNEKDVLDMLRPHENLKKLTINHYGGSIFPAWIEDPSFSSMVVLILEGCENCKSLPSLGVLSKLKELTISGMKKLTTIDSEFYGSCSEPFQSLEILCLKDLQEWSRWDPTGDDAHCAVFSCLRELSIVNCPLLSRSLPAHLPSLRKLVIQQCSELEVSISSIPMDCELEIDDCKKMVYTDGADSLSLNSISLSHFSEFGDWFRQAFWKVEELKIKCPTLVSIPQAPFLSCLSALEIKDCRAIKSLWQVIEHSACLDRLVIEGCDTLKSVAEGQLPSSLKRLQISSCANLLCLFDGQANHINASPLEYLYVSQCPALQSLSSRGQLYEALQHLEIQNCSELTTIGQLPETLKRLDIKTCRKLDSLSSAGQLPASLEHLSIDGCPITTLSSTGHLPASLQHLNIEFCLNLMSLSSGRLPATLKYLKINSCGSLSSIADDLQNLINLQQINISNCPSLESFPQGGLPRTTLTVFSISSCLKLNALPSSMHTLNSLQEMKIVNLSSLSSFPQQGLPINLTSITSLKIQDQVMQPLMQQLHKLTSLRNLHIDGCQNAVCFPQEGMEMMLPSSLTRLTLANFSKLRRLSPEGFRNLASLEYLSIRLCPKLSSFLEDDLPSSLLELYIFKCSKLTNKCGNEGKYWSNISSIPCVKIDGKYIHEPPPV